MGLTYVNETITSCLWSDERATPGQTFPGKDTFPVLGHSLILAEHPAYLSAADTNITGFVTISLALIPSICRLTWYINVGTNVFPKLAHKSYTKLPDLIVRLSLWVEISTTFTATHVQPCQGILEDLLKAQELQHGQVHCGVESETALVRTKCRVELDSVAAVELKLSFVVFPDHAELNDSFWDGGHGESRFVFRVLLEERGVFKSRCEFGKHIGANIDVPGKSTN